VDDAGVYQLISKVGMVVIQHLTDSEPSSCKINLVCLSI
jgi:hypothetical protein